MYAQKKNIENSHIIRERDRERFRELFSVFSLGVPIGLFLLLFTWQNLEVIRLGRQASQLQKAGKSLAGTNKALRLEIERLTNLQVVEEKARLLGLHTTDSSSIVTVRGTGDGAQVRQ